MAFGCWSVESLKAGERTGLNAELTENAEDTEGAWRGRDSMVRGSGLGYTGEGSMGVARG